METPSRIPEEEALLFSNPYLETDIPQLFELVANTESPQPTQTRAQNALVYNGIASAGRFLLIDCFRRSALTLYDDPEDIYFGAYAFWVAGFGPQSYELTQQALSLLDENLSEEYSREAVQVWKADIADLAYFFSRSCGFKVAEITNADPLLDGSLLQGLLGEDSADYSFETFSQLQAKKEVLQDAVTAVYEQLGSKSRMNFGARAQQAESMSSIRKLERILEALDEHDSDPVDY